MSKGNWQRVNLDILKRYAELFQRDKSLKELAEMLIEVMKEFPQYRDRAEKAKLKIIPASTYYGKTYDDMQNRLPSIEKMEKLLGWKPKADMMELLRKTVSWYAEREAN